jgi:hypothetical protein
MILEFRSNIDHKSLIIAEGGLRGLHQISGERSATNWSRAAGHDHGIVVK